MRCSTGKIKYSSSSLAEAALIESHIKRNFPPEQGPQNIYLCEYCGNWHLTSRSVDRNQRLQELIDSGELKRKQQARRWEY